ncbi:MAG: hypothetical protein ACRC6V_16380 [Bacteroidales bacterium]
MINYVKSSAKEMSEYEEAVDIVKTLLHSNSTVEDWFSYLDDHETVWKVVKEDEVVGFYTVRFEDLFAEGHPYFFKSHRRYSSAISKMMINHIRSLGFIPKTTSTSDFPHIPRFLKMLGFTQVGVEKGGIIKPNGPVDVIYFMYLK